MRIRNPIKRHGWYGRRARCLILALAAPCFPIIHGEAVAADTSSEYSAPDRSFPLPNLPLGWVPVAELEGACRGAGLPVSLPSPDLDGWTCGVFGATDSAPRPNLDATTSGNWVLTGFLTRRRSGDQFGTVSDMSMFQAVSVDPLTTLRLFVEKYGRSGIINDCDRAARSFPGMFACAEPAITHVLVPTQAYTAHYKIRQGGRFYDVKLIAEAHYLTATTLRMVFHDYTDLETSHQKAADGL